MSAFDPLATIAHHSSALYDLAEERPDAPVPTCPGWTMAELVAHLRDVHWSWATVVDELRQERVTEDPVWSGPPLVDGRAQADRLVSVLGAADPAAPCWTWAPWQQDVAFVLRHQVQEAAVHHFDAANAVGAPWSMEPAAAADAVEEFLTFSTCNAHWLPHVGAWEGFELPPPLLGTLVLQATDTGDAWTLTDAAPGAVGHVPGAVDAPTVRGTAAELLLWLYERVELPGVPQDLLARFRRFAFTD